MGNGQSKKDRLLRADGGWYRGQDSKGGGRKMGKMTGKAVLGPNSSINLAIQAKR